MLSDDHIKKILEVEYIKSALYAHDRVLVFAFGYDGVFTHVSKSVTNAFGYTKEEMITQPFIDMIHADDIERTKDIYSFFNTSGKPGYKHYVNRYVSKLGEVLNLLWLKPVEVEETGVWVASAILIDDYSPVLNAYDNGYEPFKWGKDGK